MPYLDDLITILWFHFESHLFLPSFSVALCCTCCNVRPCNTEHSSNCFYNCVCVPGVVSFSHDQVTGSVLEVSVRPGDNITLYCDCKKSPGVYIVWYRNCSHENQPPFILETANYRMDYPAKTFPRFKFLRNTSSDSYDLLIMNITQSDEGIYYCGTEHTKVEEKDHIAPKTNYRYSNVATRIILSKYGGLNYWIIFVISGTSCDWIAISLS